MQFCRAQVRAVKDKTDLIRNQFFDRRRKNFQTQSSRPLLERRTKSRTEGRAD